jgi:guanylate kinase
MASILNPGILVLSAPSGGGKTSLARALVARRNDVEITVSHTTREQRPGEVHGVHYYFVEKVDFEAMIEKDDFIEYARVFDNYYGTSIKAMEKLISMGKHAILDIDWQGARNVRRKYPDAISVFVMPPSTEALERRLRERRQDSEEVIARRMRDAANEMSHKDEFDIIITNDDFENTADELEKVLEKLGSTEHTEH